MNYRTTNNTGTNKKIKSKPKEQPRVNVNIVYTKDYTGRNEPIINGFKCIGGHPGLNGKWEQYGS